MTGYNNKKISVKEFHIDQYGELISLWETTGLTHRPKGRDSREEIERQIQLYNTKYLLAEVEGKVIGSIMATHDSRKGWINRVAVLPEYRKKGIAQMLIKEAEKWFDEEGILVAACLIEDWNDKSMNLFQKMGYTKLPDIKYFAKKKSPGV